MPEIIREAGWGAYPVLLFGGAALLLAIRHAIWPARAVLSSIIGFGVATTIAGCLGTVVGVQKSIEFARPDQGWLVLVGLSESLNNLVLAFVVLCVVTLLTMIGSHRSAHRAQRVREMGLDQVEETG